MCRSAPVTAVEAAVLDGLGEVFGEDAGGVIEIGDGAGDFEETIVGAGAEAHFLHRQLERPLPGVIEGAEGANLAGREIGVVEATGLLEGAGGENAVAHALGGGAGVVGAEFFVGHGGDFDVEVDAVQEGPADFSEVALDDAAGATALAAGIAVVAAGTSVRISTELYGEEPGWRPVAARSQRLSLPTSSLNSKTAPR